MARLALPAALRGHELIALGAGAGALFVGYTMLRNRAPVAAGAVASDGGAGFDPSALASLLVGAASNGAAAAVAGFGPGAQLGAAGLGAASQAFDSAAGLAGLAVQSSGQVAGQLADSQAFIGAAGIGLAQSLGTGLLDLLPSPIYPTIPPPVTILPPTPVITPTPAPVVISSGLWGADVPVAIRAVDPSGTRVAAAVRRAGWNYGTQINMPDLAAALKRIGHNYGTTVDPADVQWLLTH